MAGGTMVGVSILQLIPPWVTRKVIDDAIPRGDTGTLIAACVALVILHCVRGLFTFSNRYIITWVGQQVLYLVGKDLFEHVQQEHANRLASIAEPTREELLTIEASDIAGALIAVQPLTPAEHGNQMDGK